MRSNEAVVYVRETDEVSRPDLAAKRQALEEQFAQDFGIKRAQDIALQVKRIVSDAITNVAMSRSVFRENELVNQAVKIASKPGETTEAVLDHPRFRALIELTVQAYPLVVIGATRTFTTQALWADEQEMIELAGHQSGQHVLDEQVVRNAIATKHGISEEQIDAVIASTLSPFDVTVIEGLAGAGKSFTMEAVRTAYENSGYDVQGTAISWVAATVLQASAKLQSSMALRPLLNKMREKSEKGAEFFHRPTLIIVDEAGMVDTVQMAELLRYCSQSRYPVKVVLTGDTLQVVPVAAGAAMEAIVAHYDSAKIQTIRRQVSESDRLCVRLLSQRQAGKVVHMMEQKEAFTWAQNREDQIAQVVQGYMSYRLAFPDRTPLILAVDNDAVKEINTRIRDALKRLGMIKPLEVEEIAVTDTRKNFTASFSVGDEIVLRGNNPTLDIYAIDPDVSPVKEAEWTKLDRQGVFNRNSGRIVGIRKCKGQPGSMHPRGSYDFIVDLAGELPGRVIINSETFHRGSQDRMKALPMVHNYATTIYASQGQTVDHVFIVDSAGIDFRTAYVGLSRHRDHVSVYLDENDLHNRLDKVNAKRLDPRVRDQPGLEQNVRTHRYTRQEMLQEVASNWSKNAENLTAMLYERRYRLGILSTRANDKDLATVEPVSISLNNATWDSDLRATVVAEAEDPLAMATSWIKGNRLDATALCNAAEGLAKLCAWLGEAELEAEASAVHADMLAARPPAGLWDLEGATPEESNLPLAEDFAAIARAVLDAVNHRPALGQEVLERVQAGDTLSRLMSSNVRTFTEAYPTVNVDEILQLDVPLAQPQATKPSDVDLERLATPVNVIPLPADLDELIPALPAADDAEPSGMLSRLFASFLNAPEEPLPTPKVRSRPIASAPRVSSPFGLGDPDPHAPIAPPAGALPDIMEAAKAWLVKAPRPMRDVPFRAARLAMGQVAPGGSLDFINVPQSPRVGDAAGPSELFLKQSRQHWWTRGRRNEPRILARDIQGHIRARYTLDGTCVAGNHFPPAIFNRNASPQTPVYIVAGPFEMAWLAQSKILASHKTNAEGVPILGKDSVPHMVWAAADADFQRIAQDLRKTKDVVIVRAKNDPHQETWARQLQQQLADQWNVHVKVSPPLPVLDEVAAAQVALPAVPRPRVRRG